MPTIINIIVLLEACECVAILVSERLIQLEIRLPPRLL